MSVGVVAIGRNEGQRLAACLRSARRDCAAVVYVDSGSTDGSIELACALGVHVVELDTAAGFTAARARNAGFEKLLQVDPGLSHVQFVDGDCEIVAGWIEAAVRTLDSQPTTGVVCGRRRERFPTASIYNRLCDLEWDTPIGIAKACGGDAMMRVAAFRAVGGYNPAVIAGEEPELCVRLRKAGWIVQRIDAEMTLHDAAMTRFSQWWKRNVRAGHAYAQGFDMHGSPPEKFRQREVQSIEKWAAVPVLASIGLIILIAVIRPQWSPLGLLPLVLYPVLALKVARGQQHRGVKLRDALLYGMAVVVGKFPQYQGVRKFRAARRSGQAVPIIEYKGVPAPAFTSSPCTQGED